MSTTKDPTRLVLDPACPESQRELLRRGAGIEPPADAEGRVWQALIGAIGTIGTIGASAPATEAADASSRTTATATKVKAGLASSKIVPVAVALVSLAALAGLVAAGIYLAAPARDARPPAAAAVRPAVPAPAPSVAAPPPAPQPTAATPVAWDEAPPPADAGRTQPAPGARRSSAASHLRQETTLVLDARQALRGGDAARALRILEECRRLFPRGVLGQERDRLTIEALVQAGRAPEASARAAEFLRRYPDSPHAGEVRALGHGVAGGR
jgi:hypothetical protein